MRKRYFIICGPEKSYNSMLYRTWLRPGMLVMEHPAHPAIEKKGVIIRRCVQPVGVESALCWCEAIRLETVWTEP